MEYSQAYSEFVAGAIPRAKKDPAAAIPLVAGAALQSNKIHSIHSEADGFVYYIAVSSHALASEPGFRTPLAAALPGHPEHQGDGAYQLDLGAYSAVVIKNGSSMRYLFNTSDAIDSALELEDCRVFNVNQAYPWVFESHMSLSQQAGQRVGTSVLRLASVWAVLFAAIGSAAMVYDSWESANKDAGKGLNQLNGIFSGSAIEQPMMTNLAAMQKVSAVAVKAGGWIERYKNISGKEEYVAWLPAWVSRDYIEALGADVKTEYDREVNMVVAYKGVWKKKEQGK